MRKKQSISRKLTNTQHITPVDNGTPNEKHPPWYPKIRTVQDRNKIRRYKSNAGPDDEYQ